MALGAASHDAAVRCIDTTSPCASEATTAALTAWRFARVARANLRIGSAEQAIPAALLNSAAAERAPRPIAARLRADAERLRRAIHQVRAAELSAELA
jgi:hypothetical protein